MSIGTRLKELRESNGLTQVQAAARVGMKQQAWRVYETDASMPGAKLIVKICDEYGVSADWLLGLDRGKSAAQVKTGDNSAVAIGANARATVRGTFAPLLGHPLRGLAPLGGYARGESAAPGDAPMCAKCPFKKAAKNFQKIFAK